MAIERWSCKATWIGKIVSFTGTWSRNSGSSRSRWVCRRLNLNEKDELNQQFFCSWIQHTFGFDQKIRHWTNSNGDLRTINQQFVSIIGFAPWYTSDFWVIFRFCTAADVAIVICWSWSHGTTFFSNSYAKILKSNWWFKVYTITSRSWFNHQALLVLPSKTAVGTIYHQCFLAFFFAKHTISA